MKILVFGAGAIGSVFGGFLSRRHEVTLLGRRSYGSRLKRSGLKILGIWGQHLFRQFSCCWDIRHLLREQLAFDLVLVTVKSHDTADAAKALQKLIQKHTIVLSLQNGLGNIETDRKSV